MILQASALSPEEYLAGVSRAVRESSPPPKVLVLSYPSNPTAQWVDLEFYKDAVALAKKHGMLILSDIAYSEIYFDDNPPPSILQVEGAKDIAVEVNSLSKTYAMAGWRVGMVVGNERMCAALARVKSYLDYGAFTPIQVAAVAALNGPQDCVDVIRATYKSRRDVLVAAMARAGWDIPTPPASMFAWAPVPDAFKEIGSMGFSKLLIEKAGVAVSARRRVRRARRGLCAHRSRGERAPHPPGRPQRQAPAGRRLASTSARFGRRRPPNDPSRLPLRRRPLRSRRSARMGARLQLHGLPQVRRPLDLLQ